MKFKYFPQFEIYFHTISFYTEAAILKFVFRKICMVLIVKIWDEGSCFFTYEVLLFFNSHLLDAHLLL